MKPFGPKDVPENRWFESKSLAARLFIMLSGVTMNVILAFVLCVGFSSTTGGRSRPRSIRCSQGNPRKPPGEAG